MGRNRLAFLLTLLVIARWMPLAEACDSQLLSNRSNSGDYQTRKSDERCEGLIVSPVSGAGLELVSLTFGPVVDGLSKAAASTSLSIDGAGGAHVRAMGLPIGLYYRMDAELLPGHQPFRWPLDVLRLDKVSPSQVGVLAFQSDRFGEPHYIPVRIGEPDASTNAGIVAVFRTETEVTAPKWRFVPSGTAGDAAWTETMAVANEQVIIKLPPGPLRAGSLDVQWTNTADGRPHRQTIAIGP